ncbi:serine/threonine-protein kinase Nek4 [Scleropages formosus]|uniref:serine/threonine-protein kinase Nek4 n=1 Tax=Scleropages formosus TaxID=113540 RepID=UPI000877F925|nr:serine/threonine-protein kinase Nek4 [Scleropages formosus]
MMEEYAFVRVVGKGSYGEVNLVKHRTDGKQYVIKKLNLRMSSKRERRAAEQEAQLLSQLRHPNIVTYRESWEGDDCHLYIVMGFCEGGDLYHKLKQQKGELLQERQVIEWFVQIAMALQYLHEKHILHRDLKTQNIFLTKTNIIKVGDLGIARVLENQNDMASTLIGTPYYMSPELFSNKPYNYKSDVWALGCCVYEMATLKHAFNAKDMNSLVYRIVEGKLPQMPSKYNPQLGELIKSMLSKKPEERPDVKQILRQPYIKRQIALFLEATKEKTAKSRKKVPSSQASNAPPSSTPPFDSKPDQPSPAAADLHKRVKGKEENHVPQEKISGKADEPPPSPKRPFPEAAAGSSLNATGVSVATASSIDIDMLPAENRTKHVVMPSPLLQEMPHSHVETRPGKESKHVKEHPSLPEPCQRKPVPATCGHAGDPRRLLDDGAGGPDPQYRQANSREGQREPDGIQDKENTLRLLQEASGLEYSPQIKESLDSTEKLLEPFIPVIIEEPPVKQSPPAATEKDLPQLQPSCSTSGPSVSRARRQRNRERMQENQNRLKVIPPRPLPSPAGDSLAVNVKETNQCCIEETQVHTSSPSSVSGSRHIAVTLSQDRPLSARERRRLKQSQEEYSCSGLPAMRRASCNVPSSEARQPSVQKAVISRSASDFAIKKSKMDDMSRQQSSEDDCSSSTSSTDRSEGDGKEGKSESCEMQDLVQLMTQTLRMDARDPSAEKTGSGAIVLPEFRLNRKYRDTLVLHGKTQQDQVDFRFSKVPSDTTSGLAKIMRVIEHLRTDVVKGLGIKLLDRVLEIMEEDDEEQRELCLREAMGEEKYKAYAVMVRQLKFFEDVASREWGTQ